MSHKKRRGGPVPPGNQAKAGPEAPPTEAQKPEPAHGAPFKEHDPKGRVGNYETAGEHAFQQPGGKNDANRYD